jgi:hypothetical protein
MGLFLFFAGIAVGSARQGSFGGEPLLFSRAEVNWAGRLYQLGLECGFVCDVWASLPEKPWSSLKGSIIWLAGRRLLPAV